MIKVQVDQNNMLLAVEHHFENNEPLWTSNVPLSDAKAALSAKLNEITIASRVQKVDSTGATSNKTALRKDLEKKGLFVSSALTAYAAVHEVDIQQFNRLNLTKNDFSRLSGGDLLLIITDLYDAAMPIITDLEPYAVTPLTLTALLAAADAFKAMRFQPIDVTGVRKAATDAIPVLLHEAITMMEINMDKQMGNLRDTEPQFVDAYFIVRKIHHLGVRTLSLEITTLNGSDNTPLAGAHIEVVGKGIKRISTEKGLNRVQNLVEGYYTLSVSRPDFVSQMVSFTIMNHQTTQLVIEMQKLGTEVQRDKVAAEVAKIQSANPEVSGAEEVTKVQSN